MRSSVGCSEKAELQFVIFRYVVQSIAISYAEPAFRFFKPVQDCRWDFDGEMTRTYQVCISRRLRYRHRKKHRLAVVTVDLTNSSGSRIDRDSGAIR
jgi:hypothetical protein